MTLSSKHRRTLADVYARPTPAGIKWARIEALVVALGGAVTQRAGSRIAFALNGVDAVFHSPHPSPDASRPAVRSFAAFLTAAGVRIERGSALLP